MKYPSEFWKNLGKETTTEVTKLCEEISRERIMAEGFAKAIMPEKVNTMECEDQ